MSEGYPPLLMPGQALVATGRRTLRSSAQLTAWIDGGATTITATTTNPTKGTIVRDKVWWRRVGDTLDMRVEYEQSAAGTAGSGDYLFALPAGLSFDSTKVELYTGASAAALRQGRATVGHAFDGTTWTHLHVVPYDATRFRVGWVHVNGSSSGFITSAAYTLSNVTVRFGIDIRVPIAGWGIG